MKETLLLCSSLDPAEAVFVVSSPLSERFVAQLKKLLPVPVHAIPNDPEHASDLWMQDTVEFAVDGAGKPVVLLGLRGKHDQGLTCGPLDQQVARYLKEHFPHVRQVQPGTPLPQRRWIDWYGNLEVSPPVPSHPHGRLLIGKQNTLTLHPEALVLLEKTCPQWPPIFVETGWLTIGHVDEVVQFVPAPGAPGFKLLLPSPTAARRCLEKRPADENVFVGTKSETTVAALQALAANDEHQKITAALARTKTQLCRELHLTPQDCVDLPSLFENGLALIPNPVNSLVLGTTVFVPDPAYAPFREAIADALGGLGLTLHFLDCWEPYHVNAGEVHCGTNALRRKPNRGTIPPL